MTYLLFLECFVITAIVEGAAVLIVFRQKRYVYYSFLCNLLTNPALNLSLLVSVNLLGEGAYCPALLVSEIAAVFVEAAVYNYLCRFGLPKSLMLSAFLNLLSFAAGALWFAAFAPV
ncbi:MAG: hypothetical protein FWG53_11725 [Clostridiales bacterium]|nr:hypothetical protein [Clostridiales bacterium]